ncbi:MAG: NYN domain-containing protein, partial [Acidobacteriaceae bacterium]|nr:NYN domain-containing protein [Acidobacteriaceae bacterium]
MQEKLNIAVFVDYDNIEIGVKSTLRREFDVSLPLDALKERGDLVAKFAYANWGRQEPATRQMAENAVQMVQRLPSPRGDKNGADINLALDALEMAFTHTHVNAFAIVSGDSDFIPLVNKLKEYGKTVYVVGGKAFTSTILQQNCHEFISYESLLTDVPEPRPAQEFRREQRGDRRPQQGQGGGGGGGPRMRPEPLDLAQAMPLVERALQVLERRAVQPQLGLLKSTMLQLDSAFTEKAYGANSFSDFVERLKKGGFVNVSGQGGRYIIERKTSAPPDRPTPKPEEALPPFRDVLETHRMELESGVTADELAGWVQAETNIDPQAYGFQQFSEF